MISMVASDISIEKLLKEYQSKTAKNMCHAGVPDRNATLLMKIAGNFSELSDTVVFSIEALLN